jgi:O-antigen ligase
MTSRLGNAAKPPKTSVLSTPAILLQVGVLAAASIGMWVSSLSAIFVSALIGALLLPRRVLPATALWLLVLLPLNFTQFPQVFSSFVTPAVLVIAVWMTRVALDQRMIPLLRTRVRGWLIVVPFLALLLVSALVSTGHADTAPQIINTNPGRMPAWIAVFMICVVTPPLLGQICRDDVWPTVQAAFAGIGLFLGVAAAVESIVHFNPWSGLLIDEVRDATWSVFRARTSLGHPLLTSMVASVAIGVCLFPTGKVRRWPHWIGALGGLVAVVLSVSRSGVAAVGFAVFIGVLAARRDADQSVTRGRGRVISLLIAATTLTFVAFSPLLKDRSGSEEGLYSAALRSRVFDGAIKLVAERPMLGFGPGTGNTVFVEYYSGVRGIDNMINLENSALQLLISVGLPAFLLLLTGLGMIIAVALGKSRVGVAAGITAFFVSITGNITLEAIPGILALVAPLLFCAVMPQTGPRIGPPNVTFIRGHGKRHGGKGGASAKL